MRAKARASGAGILLTASLLLAGGASAQVEYGGATATGWVELGGRASWGDDDEAKFREYRELDDDGVLGGFDVLFEDAVGKYFIRTRGSNVGFEDHRYKIEAGRYGSYTVDLFYNEFRHVLSTDAVTLYGRSSGNKFSLPAGVQDRIANAADSSTQLGLELQNARPVNLRFRQLEGGGGVEYRVDEAISLFGRYRIQDRQGDRAMAIQWGSPGGTFVTFPSPVDDTTHEVRGGMEYFEGAFTFGFEYTGSYYDNEFKGVEVDNPLVNADTASASQRGRTSVDPDNSAHHFALSGSWVLPTDFPARVAATFAYGLRLQTQDFLDHTINTAIPSPALPQNDLDGRVHTILGNLVATAQPTDELDLTFRWRSYDFNNDSDRIEFQDWVRNDDQARTDFRASVPNEYTTHNGDLEAAYDFSENVVGHLGYGVEYWRRSADRQVRDLVEHGPTAKLDWQVSPGLSIQGSYAFRERDGDDYDTLSYYSRVGDPTNSELQGLRKYDQADRSLHRFDLLTHSTLIEDVELTYNVGVKHIDYDSRFGLRDEYGWNAGFESYYQVSERLGWSGWYTFEEEIYEQKSRARSADPGDPVDNWRSKNRSKFHTLGTSLDFAAIPDRLDLILGYEFHIGKEKTRTDSPPGNTQGTGGEPFNWPTVEEKLHVVSATGELTVNDNLKVRTQYRYEDFHIDDFRTGDLGPFRGGNDIYLNDTLNDYQAHVIAVTALVEF